MSYQVVTVTEKGGNSYNFVCPAFQDSKCIESVSFSEPTDTAPSGLYLSKKSIKVVSYLLSMLAIHLNFSLEK